MFSGTFSREAVRARGARRRTVGRGEARTRMLVPSKEEFIALAADHDVVPGGARDLRRPRDADLGVPGAGRGRAARVPARERHRRRAARPLQLPRHRRGPGRDRSPRRGRDRRGRLRTGASRPPTRSPSSRSGSRPGQRRARARAAAVHRRRRRVRGLRVHERVRAAVPRHAVDELDVPDAVFMFTSTVVAFDHARRVMQVIAPVRPGDEPGADYDTAVARIDAVLERLRAGCATAPLGEVGVRAEVPADGSTRRTTTSWRGAHGEGAHRGGRRLPDRAVAALLGPVRRRRARPVPGAARRQPESVHVLRAHARGDARRLQPRAARARRGRHRCSRARSPGRGPRGATRRRGRPSARRPARRREGARRARHARRPGPQRPRARDASRAR